MTKWPPDERKWWKIEIIWSKRKSVHLCTLHTYAPLEGCTRCVGCATCTLGIWQGEEAMHLHTLHTCAPLKGCVGCTGCAPTQTGPWRCGGCTPYKGSVSVHPSHLCTLQRVHRVCRVHALLWDFCARKGAHAPSDDVHIQTPMRVRKVRMEGGWVWSLLCMCTLGRVCSAHMLRFHFFAPWLHHCSEVRGCDVDVKF